MPYVPPYNHRDFKSSFDVPHRPGLYLRPAVIVKVHPDVGTIDIEWLDHPGSRQDIVLPISGQGIYELPTVGSTVIIGFDKGQAAYVLRYLPVGYTDLVGTSRKDAVGNVIEITPQIRKIAPGEKLLVSYESISKVEEEAQFNVPVTTGTYFYMTQVGDIIMETAGQDSWELNRERSLIIQNSMNYRAVTEAGILDFGLVKRELTDNDDQITENIISTTGTILGEGVEDALTEFRLRVLATADADSTTEPEVDDPLVELTLGTKVSDNGQIIKTDGTHATTSGGGPKEIIIQLKTKADQGFEFTIDKGGNLTVKVKGNVRVDVEGNSDISIKGNANVTVSNDVQINAMHMLFNAEDIKIAGNGKEQPVVLEKFLKAYYNNHTHIGNNGAPTGKPMIPSPLSKGDDISNITEVG